MRRFLVERFSRLGASIGTVLAVLVHSNLLISAAAASVAVSTTVLVGLPLDPVPVFIVFAVTMFVYSFNRLADLEEDLQNVPSRAAFVERYGRPLLVIGIVLYLVAVALAVYWQLPRAQYLVLPVVVAVVYSVLGGKEILLVKNLLVGVSWGIIPLGVGVYYDDISPWTDQILFLFGYVTAMLTIAAIVFDIKDIEGDRAEGIRTVPNRYGARTTRWVTAGATAVVGLVVLGVVLAGLLQRRYLLLEPFTLYVFGYCTVATRDRHPLLYGLVIDGEHIFLAALLLAWRYL